ncbi:hypothetical protein G6L08_22615 [Agrobacterium rhizogenes]|nr:hypothetical protein [Rhizobium rhizogenes]
MESSNRVDGILIEGQIAVGKTTVIQAVRERVERHQGRTVDISHCHLFSDPRNVAVHDKAFEDFNWRIESASHLNDEFWRFNNARCLNVLYDLNLFRKRWSGTENFRIQDRYWFSYLATALFFSPQQTLFPSNWFREHAPRFKIEFYLTCAGEWRRKNESIREGPPKSGLHKYFNEHPEVVDAFDTFCIKLASDEFGMRILDVTNMSPDFIAETIVAAAQ